MVNSVSQRPSELLRRSRPQNSPRGHGAARLTETPVCQERTTTFAPEDVHKRSRVVGNN